MASSTSSLREVWCEFLCRKDSSARYFSGLTGVAAATAPPILDYPANQFLSRLSEPEHARLLAEAVDLMTGPYTEFFEEEAQRLLRSLRFASVPLSAVVGPHLKGSVDWAATLLGRSAGALAPSAFATRLTSRTFNTPANRVVRALAEEVYRATGRLEGAAKGSAPPALRSLGTAARHVLASYQLRGSDADWRLRHDDIWVARHGKDARVRIAADLLQRRLSVRELGVRGRWPALLEMIRTGWLSPVSDDDLFELYALALVLDILEQELGGGPDRYGLIVRGRDSVAEFDRPDGKRIRVYFDQSPSSVLASTSRYVAVAGQHIGLDVRPRRPDLLIVLERPSEEPRLLLIECKNTADGKYIRDSVYKAFAYLYDLQSFWKSCIDYSPRCILLVPEGIVPKSASNPEVLVVAGSAREMIVKALRGFVQPDEAP